MISTNRKRDSPKTRLLWIISITIALVLGIGMLSISSQPLKPEPSKPKESLRTLSGIQTPAAYVNSSFALPFNPPNMCVLNPNNEVTYILSDNGIVVINTTNFNRITKETLYPVDSPVKLVLSPNGEIGYLGNDSPAGLMLLDLSNVASGQPPTLISNLTLHGINSLDVSTNGELTYITDEDSGLRIVNVTNTLEPIEIISTGLDKSGLGFVTGVQMLSNGKTVVATDYETGLKMLNMDDTMIASSISSLAIGSPDLLFITPDN